MFVKVENYNIVTARDQTVPVLLLADFIELREGID